MNKTALETQKRKADWFAVYSDASGFSIPLRGLKMRRFNVFSFYKLGACLAPLRLLDWLAESELAHEILFTAKNHLDKLRSESFPSMQVLSGPASAISVAIDEAYPRLAKIGRVGSAEQGFLTKSVEEFETVLKAQTPTEHTYTVEQLRGFSMPILVDGAEQNFSPVTILRVGDEVKKDIQEAGRCLAFELPTAAGIHMMRAFEKVFRQFYKVSTGNEPGHIDIFKLIKELRDFPNVDQKVLNILDQIRDLHRNPLAHEVFLEMDDAVELFDIAKSAITAMARTL
ncbi:MAG: DUF4145 domain-containing protein [Terriglobia bacterium]